MLFKKKRPSLFLGKGERKLFCRKLVIFICLYYFRVTPGNSSQHQLIVFPTIELRFQHPFCYNFCNVARNHIVQRKIREEFPLQLLSKRFK